MGKDGVSFIPLAKEHGQIVWSAEINLVTENSSKSSQCLERYLSYEAVQTGKANEAIKDDYEKLITQRQIETHLPRAWENLVKREDKFLLDLLAKETQGSCVGINLSMIKCLLFENPREKEQVAGNGT